MIPKKNRLNRSALKYLFKKGLRQKTNYFNVIYKKGSTEEPRFSIIVSKKIKSKAVDRNKLRRRIYETIRTNTKEEETTKIMDIALIAKQELQKISFKELKKHIISTLKKLHEEK